MTPRFKTAFYKENLTMETSNTHEIPRARFNYERKLNLPRGRVHIHHLTETQRNIVKVVASMQEMSMSQFVAESALAVMRKLKAKGPKAVKDFLATVSPEEGDGELRMQIGLAGGDGDGRGE